MPAVRKIKIPLADPFWLPFFSKSIQATLEQLRKFVTERSALLSYCECVCFFWGSPIQISLIKDSYRPPQRWKDVYGDDHDFEVLGTDRGDLSKPPHGTTAGFAFHFDDCPVLVAKLLMQVAGFDFLKLKFLKDRLALCQDVDPGAGIRHQIWLAESKARRRAKTLRQPLVPKKRLKEIKKYNPENWQEIVAGMEKQAAIWRAKLGAEKPVTFSDKQLKEAERRHAEWHEIEKMMNAPTDTISFEELHPQTYGALNLLIPKKEKLTIPPAKTLAKGKISQAAHDAIKARVKILKCWPSVSDFVPPELLSTRIEVIKNSPRKRKMT